MKALKSFLYIIVSVVCLITCVSCKKNYSEEFLKSSCDAPCWNGIEIGMKKQDVFREIEHIESFSVLGDTIDETESFYRLQNENNSTVVTMKFEQNILTNLDFIVSKGYNLRLNEVIELIGQPTYTLGWFTGHGLASRKVFLCYSEKGIQVDLVGETHHEPPNHPYKVSEDSKVWTINVFRPDIPNNLNSNYYACLEAESHYYVQKEWHGYGVYITCDPETMDWCGE